MAYTEYAPDRVISGTELYVIVDGRPDNLPPGYEAYCTYLIAWELVGQAGEIIRNCAVEYSYQNGNEPAHIGLDGKSYCVYPPFSVNLILGEYQAAGNYTFRFVLDCIGNTMTSLEDGIKQTIEVPLAIAQKPLPIRYDNTHPIPNLEAWQQHMIELADKWERQLLNPDNTWGSDNWYYDICSTYLEIGKYIQNSMKYWDVAYNAACRYRDYLFNECQPPGAANGWSIFPRGMRQMYQSTRDPQWRDALLSLLNAAWVRYGGSPDPLFMRETAYAAAEYIELTWIGVSSEMLERSITYILGQFNLLCAQSMGKGQGMPCEPFFFGLAMQSLIDYYDIVKDDRIPQSLMTTCAWLWNYAVDANNGRVLYDVWSPGGVAGDNETAYTGLNPLMYNAWGFLYSTTGDNQWRRQGDILFEHQFDDGSYSWSPKQFAQIYRRSTDYVTRWRA